MKSKTKANTVPAHDTSALPVWHLDDTCPDYMTGYDAGNATLQHVLHEALTLRREHGSIEEAKFVAWLAEQFSPTLIDGAGNLHFDRRGASGSATLFTAHTDTVHHDGGVNVVRIDRAGNGNIMLRADTVTDQPLGADDGAGLAIMFSMMERGVPGYYIAFRGEECGGVGSSWLAEYMPGLLGQFSRAVAFDRAGYHDVITHQSGGRCCSDTFADALGAALSGVHDDVMFLPCDGGVYTDTAEFVSIIPECTNLSIGYAKQHSSREEQDLTFLVKLADVCCKIDWEALPTERDPKVRESLYGGLRGFGGYGGIGGLDSYGGYGGYGAHANDDYRGRWDAGPAEQSQEEFDEAFAAVDAAQVGDNAPLTALLAKYLVAEYTDKDGVAEISGAEAELVLARALREHGTPEFLETLLDDLCSSYTVRNWAVQWAEDLLS